MLWSLVGFCGIWGNLMSDDPLQMALEEAERQAASQEERFSSPEYTAPRPQKQEEPEEEKPKPTRNIMDPEQETVKPVRRARDGQTFAQQNGMTKSAFRYEYGDRAEEEWVRQHEAELDKNRATYGTEEPTPGAKPLSGVTGAGPAPDRTIREAAPAAASDPAGAHMAAPGPSQAPAPTPYSANAASERISPDTMVEVRDTVTGQSMRVPYWYYQERLKQYPGNDKNIVITELPPGTPPNVSVGSAPPSSPPAQAAGATPGSPAPSSAPAATPPRPPSPDDTVTIRSAAGGTLQVKRSQVGEGPGQYGSTPQKGGYQIVDDPATKPTVQASALSMKGDTRPVNEVVNLMKLPDDVATKVLGGIGKILQGDPSGKWAAPYLNDVARLAWAKQREAAGQKADPLDAPQDYIESWLDAFMGSDHNVPLVADLDQQMIDHAVDRTPAGRPFNWKEAFGDPTSPGGSSVISRQVATNDCGPNAFSNVLRSYGYNADPANTFQYAKDHKYHTGDMFTGAHNYARMLREEAGLDAKAVPIDWRVIDSELEQGRIVTLSSGGSTGHYWTVAAKRDGPNGPEYFTGATGAVVGNPSWSSSSSIRYGGAPETMIIAQGQVDPNSRAVRELGLKPPTGSGANARTLMSVGARATQRISSEMAAEKPPEYYYQIGEEAGKAYGVDPLLVRAVMEQESGGAAKAKSGAGARGPMQLMPATAKGLGARNVDDPEETTVHGVRYLMQMLERYKGNTELALAAYNAGPGAVDEHGGIPPYGETQKYVPAVMATYRRLQAERKPR